MLNDPSSHGPAGVAKTLLTPLYGRAHADRLLPDSAVRLHAASITDPDRGDALPEESGPTLVVVEGALMCPSDREVARFLADVGEQLGPRMCNGSRPGPRPGEDWLTR
ncbi:hypothetical protein [Kitasatospora sp. NPDC058218]|uniref:hypothetical protein n=1 Tax=Kitasatospora sp. NPDC058218 TaxID=3346385 RepID=UPI0036D94D8A